MTDNRRDNKPIIINVPRRIKNLPYEQEARIGKAARTGDVVALDMMPAGCLAAHLPFARSIPLDELKQRLAELPRGKTVVAYCRGPYYPMARDAVAEILGIKKPPDMPAVLA